MAGYGNRTAPTTSPEALTQEHAGTRLGLTESHSVRCCSLQSISHVAHTHTLSLSPTLFSTSITLCTM